MTDRTYLVREIKDWLEARGQQWKTNEDAFQITGRVAWALRREGVRLVPKQPGQNGATTPQGKYSHDALVLPDGWVDCLIGGGPPQNENTPAWQHHGLDHPGMPTVSADPFNLDADQPDPEPEPDPELGPLPEELSAVATALRDVAVQLRLLVEAQGAVLAALTTIVKVQARGLKPPKAD